MTKFWEYFDKYWMKSISIVAILNFFVFVGIASYIGGDALNGRIEDGHFFLASHGVYTEVSESVFTYSKIHAISMLVTHAVFFFSAGLLFLKKRLARKLSP